MRPGPAAELIGALAGGVTAGDTRRAMAEENLRIVRQLYERFPDLADPEPVEAVIEALFAPEVHLDMTRRVFNPASYDGHDGLRRALVELRETWEQFLLRPERFLEAGSEVVVVETVEGRGRGVRSSRFERGRWLGWSFTKTHPRPSRP